jgi:hypothetical protein
MAALSGSMMQEPILADSGGKRDVPEPPVRAEP